MSELNGNIVHREIRDARIKAEEIVKETELKAVQILNDAELNAGEMMKQAYEEGLQSGLADAVIKVVHVHRYCNKLESENEANIFKIAIRVAEKIINHEILTEPETVIGIVRNHLEGIRHQRSIIVQLNPDDQQICEKRITDITKQLHYPEEIRFVEEPDIERGGCRIILASGIIDARLHIQMEAVQKVLMDTADIRGKELFQDD
jgi:flagellar biosynthesis/type III secretory pathway protein FliH